MTLTKKKMVREIGRRTRLTNREVQEVIETLIDVWTEALVDGEKIEIQNFFVLEVKEIERSNKHYRLGKSSIPKTIRYVTMRSSKRLKHQIQQQSNESKSKL